MVVATRANFDASFALGAPFIHFRYFLIVAPALVPLTFAALDDLPFARRHWIAGLAISVVLTALYVSRPDDFASWKQWCLVVLPLLIGICIPVAFARRRLSPSSRAAEGAAALVTIAAGLSVASTLGGDLYAISQLRNEQEARTRALENLAPERFAVVGEAVMLDPVLSLTLSRNLQYRVLWQADDRPSRRLLRHWAEEGRPVYGVISKGAAPWPGTRFVPMPGREDIVKVELGD